MMRIEIDTNDQSFEMEHAIEDICVTNMVDTEWVHKGKLSLEGDEEDIENVVDDIRQLRGECETMIERLKYQLTHDK